MTALARFLQFFRKLLQEENGDFSVFLSAGPISVFCTLVVALQQNCNFDLVFLAIFGTIFCMKEGMRGWIYSSILLFASAIIKHAFFIENHHLWQMGIEGSMLASFAMISAAYDLQHLKEANLASQLMSQKNTIQNLEEELVAVRQEAQEEQISSQNRLAQQQRDFDENLSEISSLQVLNDVLRKTTAQTDQEREAIVQKFLDMERQSISFSNELQKHKLEALLWQEKFADQESEFNRLHDQFQSSIEQLAERDETIQALQSEEILLQKKGEAKEMEWSQLQSQMQGCLQQIADRDQAMALLQERLQSAAQKEGLYLELRKQFDEKNKILHQTRVELFQTVTALEAIRLEQDEQKTGDPSDQERVLSNELMALEQQRQLLEEENEKLFDLITCLSKESPAQIMERLQQQIVEPAASPIEEPAPKKRTRKKKTVIVEQATLPGCEEPLYTEHDS